MNKQLEYNIFSYKLSDNDKEYRFVDIERLWKKIFLKIKSEKWFLTLIHEYYQGRKTSVSLIDHILSESKEEVDYGIAKNKRPSEM